ncbi:hypothetical protein ACPB67_02680 [Micromonospora taraxaci]|uniref:hypothetical protein n=1 Tax=Micromonospora taraxaci TaxID=1316803 RepID=UPI003C30451E
MDPAVWAAVASGLAAIIASVVTNRVASRASRRDSMLKWNQQLRESENAARQEAQQSRDRAERIKDEADSDVQRLRAQLDELHVQLQMATSTAAKLTDTLISVASEVWRPEPDIPALRRLVGRPQAPGVNGRAV